MNEAVKQRIEDNIKGNKIFLYMKGTPNEPQCGFSAQVVAVLKTYNIPFETFDIFQDEEIRQGIKEFSDWPTIPQLYVNGEFIGGCDIITELHNNNELAPVLNN